MHRQRSDSGFSLIELLLVIVILGILSTVVVLSISGITGEAEESACEADKKTLEKSAEAYFAQRKTDTIPDAGGDEGVEQTLVDAELLRQTSEYYDVQTDGQLVSDTDSVCLP